ncbi:MAG: IPT/TIG domain-containing protein [Planctomycetes bacterium]|nr:IPT/TIG domain-containing protein [Planctomycetota bacterium]
MGIARGGGLVRRRLLVVLAMGLVALGCARRESKTSFKAPAPTGTASSASTSGTGTGTGGGATVPPVVPASTAATPSRPLSARTQHTATRLNSGDVLVLGGMESSTAVSANAEVYEAANGRFVVTRGRPIAARVGHTATLLPSGQVLVIGGQSDTAGQQVLDSTEFYDPATGAFRAGTRLGTPRSGHVAAVFNAQGTPRVLVAGGMNRTGTGGTTLFLNSAEIYDVATGQVSPVAARLTQNRMGGEALTLPNGSVLVQGGVTLGAGAGGQTQAAVADAEVFDPAASRFVLATPSAQPRFYNSLTLLTSGDALLVGGNTLQSQVLDSAERFQGTGANFAAVAGRMNAARESHTASVLPGGQVVIIGGGDGTSPLATTEVYDAVAGTFQAGPSLTTSRKNHTATTLANGTVLVVGGEDAQKTPLASSEIYTPGTLSGPTGPTTPATPPTTGTSIPTTTPPGGTTGGTTGGIPGFPGLPGTGGTTGGTSGGTTNFLGQALGTLLGGLLGNQSGSPVGQAFGNLFGNILGGALSGQPPSAQTILPQFLNLFGTIMGQALSGSGGGSGGGSAFPGTPEIDALQPATAAVGDTITILGTDFDPTAANNVVKFGGIQARVLRVLVGQPTSGAPTPASIQAVVPQGLFAGQQVDVTVTVSNYTTNAKPFTVR